MRNKKPNIILILTDQQRLSTMSCYKDTVCITPRLGELEKDSVRFNNAYTSCPLCSPARATIMTGLYPHSHGITTNTGEIGCVINELEDSHNLLSRQLQNAGYDLGYTGKWHLGTDNDFYYGKTNKKSLPKDVGFEGQNFPGHGSGGFKFTEYLNYLKSLDLERKIISQNDFGPMLYGKYDMPEEGTIPFFLTENTISLVDRFSNSDTGNPFFIWHNFWGPHHPCFAPQKYLDLYNDIKIKEWPNYKTNNMDRVPSRMRIHPRQDKFRWEDWERFIKHYYAYMTLIDAQIGRLIDHLKYKNILDNTIIIFTSDHGDNLGSHGGLLDKGFNHYEEVQRIPLLIRLPEDIKKERTRDELVSLCDIYPTILEAAGITDIKVHGESLFKLFNDEAVKWRDSAVVEFHGMSNTVLSLRTIRYKNIKYGLNFFCKDELYDLDKDPGETINQIDNADYKDILYEMRLKLLKWMDETEDPVKRMFINHIFREGDSFNAAVPVL